MVAIDPSYNNGGEFYNARIISRLETGIDGQGQIIIHRRIVIGPFPVANRQSGASVKECLICFLLVLAVLFASMVPCFSF